MPVGTKTFMALAAHLVRRTATYDWRRRLPAALGAKVLLISLRTSDPARARRLGPLVTAESNRAFDDFAAEKADYEAVLAHLQIVIRRESMDLPAEVAPRPAIAGTYRAILGRSAATAGHLS